MADELTRAANEKDLRDLRAKGIGTDGNASVGMDRAYLLLDEIDELRAETLALKAQLDETTSAIPAIVANHVQSHRADLVRFVTGYRRLRLQFGDDYAGLFAECDRLADLHEADRPLSELVSAPVEGAHPTSLWCSCVSGYNNPACPLHGDASEM